MLTRSVLTKTFRTVPKTNAVPSFVVPNFAPLPSIFNNTPIAFTRQYAHGHGHVAAVPKVERPITSNVVVRVTPLAQAPKRVVDHNVFVVGDSIAVWHDNDTFSLNFIREAPVGLAEIPPREQWPLAGPEYLQWGNDAYAWHSNKAPRPDKDAYERTPSRRIKAFVHRAKGRMYTIYPNGPTGQRFHRSHDDYLDGHIKLPDPNLKTFLSAKIGHQIYTVGTPFIENDVKGLRICAWDVDADRQWREVHPTNAVTAAPLERENYSITAVGDKIFVWHSNINENQDTQLSVYDTVSNTWSTPTQTGDLPGKLSKFATTVLSDGKVLVTGGASIDAHKEPKHYFRPYVYHTHPENKVYLFDPANFKWEEVNVEGTFPAIFGHTATLLPRHPADRVVVIGGTDSASNKNGTANTFVLDRATLKKK